VGLYVPLLEFNQNGSGFSALVAWWFFFGRCDLPFSGFTVSCVAGQTGAGPSGDDAERGRP
jgi:hypothetical protein